MKHLALIVTGAPLTARAVDLAAATVGAGWSVVVIATPAASPWLDHDGIAAVCGTGPQTEYRSPGEPKRGPRAHAVVVCPATFNTVNKAACGIADTYAMGVLCEAIGAGVPVAMFPMINNRLWGHLALASNLETLQEAGVRLFDPATGRHGARPGDSGSGDEVVARFDPAWILAALS
ncbi:MAG: flavoprotein [Micromonosporaceae bacterium]|nr:flavoprotein [Micromonosporaceae bacterium]